MTALTKTTVIGILLIVATIGVEAVREIPEFLHICHVDQPEYETCVINSVNNLKPYLKVGVPEYNIPCLEPLKLKKLSVSPTNSLLIQGTDVNVYGASNFEVNKVKLDFNKLKFMVNVTLPNIIVEGKYDMDGKVLLLPLRGSGALKGNFSNWIGICRIHSEKYLDEDGVEKIRAIDFKLKLTVGTGTVRLDNLFNGDQVLGDVINSSINNNFDIFMKEILPLVEMALSDAFRNLTENIIDQFSFAQLFPGV